MTPGHYDPGSHQAIAFLAANSCASVLFRKVFNFPDADVGHRAIWDTARARQVQKSPRPAPIFGAGRHFSFHKALCDGTPQPGISSNIFIRRDGACRPQVFLFIRCVIEPAQVKPCLASSTSAPGSSPGAPPPRRSGGLEGSAPSPSNPRLSRGGGGAKRRRWGTIALFSNLFSTGFQNAKIHPY